MGANTALLFLNLDPLGAVLSVYEQSESSSSSSSSDSDCGGGVGGLSFLAGWAWVEPRKRNVTVNIPSTTKIIP